MQDEARPTRPGRAAVMADVGRLAGVSHQTVSRVINGSRHVSPATRARVLAAMDELGYRPNSIARALATGRSRTFGVVSFDTTLFGPASTLFGIERAAHQAGYFTLVVSLRALDRVAVTAAVDRLRVHGVDGILAIVSEASAIDALLEADVDIPLVFVEAGPESGSTLVCVDQREGARMATQHLLDLGHRTVHQVTGPPDSIEARLRVEGWRGALREAGAPVPEPLIGDWTARTGYHVGARLIREPDVSAAFVANDQMALGLLRAVHEAGWSIPDDLSIVGFDDTPEAPYFPPPLTTIAQDFGEMGSRGVRTLVSAIEAWDAGRPAPDGSIVAPELVVRGSTAAPRLAVDRRQM